MGLLISRCRSRGDIFESGMKAIQMEDDECRIYGIQ